MAWNHRSAVVAMAVVIQPTAGLYQAPTLPDHIVPVSVPNNDYQGITADDPTATGAIWKSRRIYLGRSGTSGCTIPIRGPGGAAPPLANVWPVGYFFQAAGCAEIRSAAPATEAFQAGSTTTAVVLANTRSAVDDTYIGTPIQFTAVGTGFRQTTLLMDYTGATKTGDLAETLGGAPAGASAYTIPAYLSYRLGTLTTAPPLLSITIWRDGKKYMYKDWRPTSFSIDMPVTNEANTVFPSIDVSGKCSPAGVADEVGPVVPDAVLAIPPVACRAGKWMLDRTKLGHQSTRFVINLDIGAASNQNADAGQDEYNITGGNRSLTLDVNDSAVTDFDFDSRIDNQTIIPILSTWGGAAGNRFGVVFPHNVLDPMSPGDRNGFVNLTGDAQPTDIGNSMAFTIWW